MPTLSELREPGALAEFSAAVARESASGNRGNFEQAWRAFQEYSEQSAPADHLLPARYDCRLSQQEIETLIDTAAARQVGGDHYTKLAVQPWDAMQAWMTPEAFKGYLLGNTIKYLARDKGDRLQDLQKAAHYLQRLIEIEQGESA